MNDHDRDEISRRFNDRDLIDKALRLGVREALLRHKQLGLPIAEWRDGKVVWVPPEEIRIGNEP